MSYKKVKDVINELEAHKFWFVRQKVSHMVYTNGSKVVVVPNHTKKKKKKGTYYNILRQAGISK